MTLQFLLTSLIVVLIPGTGVLYTISEGLSRGVRSGAVAAFGCTLGIVPHMLAAITGLAGLLNASASAFQVFKLLGVAYLLYMAWSTLRDRNALTVVAETAPAGPGAMIVKGILINLLNPKLTIFFFAFLPQFVAASDPAYLARMAVLSSVFMLLTFAVFVCYAVFASLFRTHVITRPRVQAWLRRSFAAAFAGLGLSLLATSRN